MKGTPAVVLVTANLDHMTRVRGLRIQDWNR